MLTYALNFTLSIVFTVRLHAQMEMSINAIERLDEYCKVSFVFLLVLSSLACSYLKKKHLSCNVATILMFNLVFSSFHGSL